MPKVILEGHIIVPEADLTTVQAELPVHIELTRGEAGCLRFEVTKDAANGNRFSVYEEFSDRDAFELHQARVRNSRWGEVTGNVERHYQVSDSA